MGTIKKVILLSSVLILLAAGCNQQAQKPEAQTSDLDQSPQIQVSQKVEGEFSDKLFNFYQDENKTALDMLNESYKVETSSSTVISIDGTKPDKNHFWQMFVNNTPSTLDPANYKPQNGDKIEWKLSLKP